MDRASRARWLWLTAAVVAADQFTKYAVECLIPENSPRAIIPGLLNLVHTYNPGIALGLLADAESKWVTTLLIIFSTVVMLALAWLLARGHIRSRITETGLALILGGAAGNWIDRLRHGSVLDFVDFYLRHGSVLDFVDFFYRDCDNRDHHWHAFNVADSVIVIGAGLVILELLAGKHEREGAKP